MSVAASRLECLHNQYLGSREYLGSRARLVNPRRKPLLALLPAVSLFAALVLQLTVRLTFIEKGYQLESLRRISLQNDTKLREKRLEQALLTRPTFIQGEAKGKLGMSETEPQRLRKMGLD